MLTVGSSAFAEEGPAAGRTASEDSDRKPVSTGEESREGGSHPIRDALLEHSWHLGAVIGAELLANEYHSAYGPSTDPLLFASPGPLDESLRTLVSGSKSANFLWDNGTEALKYATPLVLVGMDWGDGGLLTRDLVGFLEAMFTKRAATSLLKDIVGRERPRLEYAEEDGLGPNAIEELDAKKGNHQSFPSGHTSGAFTFAAYLERAVAREVGLDSPWRKVSFAAFYGVAGWIAWGRMRVDKHYLTDVVAGAALGIGVARGFYRHAHPEEFDGGRASHREGRRRIVVYPPVLVPGGAALTIGIRTGPLTP